MKERLVGERSHGSHAGRGTGINRVPNTKHDVGFPLNKWEYNVT